MKIAICIPCHGDAKLGFTVSLARMMAYSARALPDAELEILTESSAILPASRTSLVERAEKIGARFVLWLDADMTFPPDTLERLLKHKARFVGTNYLRRRDGGPSAWSADKVEIETTREKATAGLLEEVGQFGFGVCLMGIDVLAAIRAKAAEDGGRPYPLFAFEPNDKSFIGEDYYFCRRARHAGVRLLVDHALSWEIGHIGELTLIYT